MVERRLLGIDLGIASAHTAVVLREDGTEVCRRRCVPTASSFRELERAAIEGAPEGTRLEVVMEPTGPAWLPVAVYFGRRGPAELAEGRGLNRPGFDGDSGRWVYATSSPSTRAR